MSFKKVPKSYIFYCLTLLIIFSVLFSNPFLRYPYDMFHHLIVIDDLYMKLKNPIHTLIGAWVNDIYFMLPTAEIKPIILAQPKYLWHYIWAEFFHLINIDSAQLFLRAQIIHVVQTFISLGSIYYFSHVVLRNIFKNISAHTLKWLSLWSLIIWLSIYATVSGPYHQVWIMWYSINYQISLPLFWYMLSLTLVLLLEHTSWKIKLFFVLQILLISRFIIQVHSMEFMYYLMHLAILTLVFIDKVYFSFKKYYFLLIPLIGTIIYLATHYRPARSPIFNYLSLEKLPDLYEKIMREGALLLHGYNRASASINELMYVIGILGFLFLFYRLYLNYYQKIATDINIRMLIFIAITSCFVLIPLYQFTGGLFSLITYTNVVNRLYYSASLFVLLPIVIYGILSLQKRTSLIINSIILSILILTAVLSKHSDVIHHNYYKNLLSIKHSFNQNKIGFHLKKSHIEMIKKNLEKYEKEALTYKTIRYYARADIAFVIKYILKKDVYWEGRRANPDYIKTYNTNKSDSSVYPVLFEIPKNFPPYHPYR